MPVAATRGDALRLKVSGVEVRHLAVVGTISGVAILAAAGRNGPGVGRIRSTGDGTTLAWRAPGSATFGEPVTCAVDGDYLLCDGDDADAWVRVQVAADYLAGGPVSAAVHLQDVFNNGVGHDDVTAGEAASGDVTDYTVTMANESANAMYDVKAWLSADTDDLEISTDGVGWVAPTSETHPDVLEWASIADGASETLHIRRTIGAGADSDPDLLNKLHFSWEGN